MKFCWRVTITQKYYKWINDKEKKSIIGLPQLEKVWLSDVAFVVSENYKTVKKTYFTNSPHILANRLSGYRLNFIICYVFSFFIYKTRSIFTIAYYQYSEFSILIRSLLQSLC